jgi:hypothetical protein
MGIETPGTLARVGTPYFAQLPEEFMRIVSGSVNLFELVKTKIDDYGNSQEFGFINCRMDSYVSSYPKKLHYIPRWLTRENAYVRFTSNKNGFCFGFVPDDEHWFNRMKLAATINSAKYTIERYHTKEGMVSGEQITKEILYLQELTHRWCVKSNGKTVFRSMPDRRGECEGVLQELRAKGQDRAHIVFGKTEEIEKLIIRYGSNWFFCPEFTDLKKQIIEKTVQKFKDLDIVSKKQMLGSLIRGLNPQDIMQLLQNALPPGSTDVPTALTVPAAAEKDGIGIEDLKEWSDIRRFARHLKVDIPKGTTREEAKKILADVVAERAEMPSESDQPQIIPEMESQRYETPEGSEDFS